MNEELAEHYRRNAIGHDEDCRKRIVPTIGSTHRALDPERCERCRVVVAKLDAAHARRVAQGHWQGRS